MLYVSIGRLKYLAIMCLTPVESHLLRGCPETIYLELINRRAQRVRETRIINCYKLNLRIRIDAGVITENACWISFACLSSIDEVNAAFFVEDKPANRMRTIPLASLALTKHQISKISIGRQ
jgi:hypothetical protein